MNNLLKIIIGLFFLYSTNLKAEPLNDLVVDLSNQIKSTQTIRIAVLTFPYIDGFDSKGSKIVQERLITALSGNKRFSVLERALLHKILEEKKLEMSGLFDEATTTKLGRMLGVHAVLTGTLMDINDKETEINGRIIDVGTGEIIASCKTTMIKIWQDKISIPKPIFEPARVPEIEEIVIPKSDFKIETEYADIETLEKYDEIARFDKSEALPLEKVKRWKEFAVSYPRYKDIAIKRAKEWKDYDIEFKKMEELKAKRLDAIRRDYQTLRRYLALTIISPEQKTEWAMKFMENYGYGEDNIYKNEVSKYILPFEPEETMDWDQAPNYCKKNGGRLPTVVELKEMYKNECSGDKYEAGRCKRWYWSSEEYVPTTTYAMLVGFNNGSVSPVNKTNYNYVRCVRATP